MKIIIKTDIFWTGGIKSTLDCFLLFNQTNMFDSDAVKAVSSYIKKNQ